MSITKIYSRKVRRKLNYTTEDHLIEELGVFESQTGWSIFEILKVLEQKKADSFSITKVVIEVNADEITLSPVHPCGMGAIREGSGMTLRFPPLHWALATR